MRLTKSKAITKPDKIRQNDWLSNTLPTVQLQKAAFKEKPLPYKHCSNGQQMQAVTLPEEWNEHNTINGVGNYIYVLQKVQQHSGTVTVLLFPLAVTNCRTCICNS